MTRDQVKEIFKLITHVYQRFDVTSEKLDIWHYFLADQDYKIVRSKTLRHIKNEKFPPTVAEIITIKPKKSVTQIEHEKMLKEHREALAKERSQ